VVRKEEIVSTTAGIMTMAKLRELIPYKNIPSKWLLVSMLDHLFM